MCIFYTFFFLLEFLLRHKRFINYFYSNFLCNLMVVHLTTQSSNFCKACIVFPRKIMPTFIHISFHHLYILNEAQFDFQNKY